jgi:hypothetical protein
MFHKELEAQINEIITDLKNGILNMPKNWHWLDYKNQSGLLTIKKEDLDLAKKLNQLHAQGKDIPSLNLRMLQLCNELQQHLDNMARDKKSGQVSGDEEKIRQIIDEISQIYAREFTAMQRESKKLLYDNSVIHKLKGELIDGLN